MTVTYSDFDPADYLGNDEAMTEYLTAVMEEPNLDAFLTALGDAARARGMARVASASGLGRESLYKALSAGAQPRFQTIAAVVGALGLRLTVVTAAGSRELDVPAALANPASAEEKPRKAARSRLSVPKTSTRKAPANTAPLRSRRTAG